MRLPYAFGIPESRCGGRLSQRATVANRVRSRKHRPHLYALTLILTQRYANEPLLQNTTKRAYGCCTVVSVVDANAPQRLRGAQPLSKYTPKNTNRFKNVWASTLECLYTREKNMWRYYAAPKLYLLSTSRLQRQSEHESSNLLIQRSVYLLR